MGHFDFDCLVCGGERDNIKRGGYFGYFHCSLKGWNGECGWCEGCYFRQIKIKDFFKFHNTVQVLSNQKMDIDLIVKELDNVIGQKRFIPNFLFGLYYESGIQKVKEWLSSFYSLISFERYSNLTKELSDKKKYECLLDNFEWTDENCLYALKAILDEFNKKRISLGEIGSSWTTIQLYFMLSNRINLDMNDTWCLKGEEIMERFKNGLSKYGDYFKIRNADEDIEYDETCCMFQSYLNSMDDPGNINYHYKTYEEYGNIDYFRDNSVTSCVEASEIMWSKYAFCNGHIDGMKLNHFHNHFEIMNKDQNFIDNKIMENLENRAKFISERTKLLTNIVDIIRTKRKKVASVMIDILAVKDMKLLKELIKSGRISFEDEEIEWNDRYKYIEDLEESHEPMINYLKLK